MKRGVKPRREEGRNNADVRAPFISKKTREGKMPALVRRRGSKNREKDVKGERHCFPKKTVGP